jgi:hypothetical protein
MIVDRARFDKLSMPVQALVFAALPFPLFIVFAVIGDIPRGALVWWFSFALLNALYACEVKRISIAVVIATAALIAVHVTLVIWNPLRHFHLLGGLFLPIVIVDYCIDYAILWMILRVFRTPDP